MLANDVSNMLYSILVFISAFSGAWNLYLLIKLQMNIKECQRLKKENKAIMDEMNTLYNDKPFLK